jgi:hypothetical protein
MQMYISNQHTIFIYSLVFLLFAMPLVILAMKPDLFRRFTFDKLIVIFNKALLPQVIVGLFTLLIAFVFYKTFYANGEGNIFTDIFIETAYCYCIIGLFMYLPSVRLLNIIKFVTVLHYKITNTNLFSKKY